MESALAAGAMSPTTRYSSVLLEPEDPHRYVQDAIYQDCDFSLASEACHFKKNWGTSTSASAATRTWRPPG